MRFLLALVVAAASAVASDLGDLVRDSSASLVFIEGGGGSGSGFVCRTKDGVFLFTNQHVVAEMPSMKATRLDNTSVPAGAPAAAVGHDLMRFATKDVPNPFVATDNLDADARIGDEVAVLGNSEGSRVIAPLAGRLLGIGPDRIEVSAEFVPGNSGSPIIHVKTGKVIGIATYLETRRFGQLADTKVGKVRRFGYRLDSVKQWQAVAWPAYQAEHTDLAKIEALTKDLAHLIDDMANDGNIDPRKHNNPVLARPLGDLDRAMTQRNLSAPDRQRAMQEFLATLRSATTGDIVQARQRMRYDYFRRSLDEQAAYREQFHKIFDKLMKAQRP